MRNLMTRLSYLILFVVVTLSTLSPLPAQIGSSTARRIQSGPVLPAHCSPLTGDVFNLTAGGPIGTLEQCTSPDTWTAVAGGAGAITSLTGDVTASGPGAAVSTVVATRLASPLPLAQGGTNGTDAAVNGGIVWSNATQHKISALGATNAAWFAGGVGVAPFTDATVGPFVDATNHRVGIGTTSPEGDLAIFNAIAQGTLTVAGAAGLGGIVRVSQGTNVGGGTIDLGKGTDPNGHSALGLFRSLDLTNPFVYYDASVGDTVLSTRFGGAGLKFNILGVTFMTMLSSGNVGIGVASPTVPLDVLGAIHSSTTAQGVHVVGTTDVSAGDSSNSGALDLKGKTSLSIVTQTVGDSTAAYTTTWPVSAPSGTTVEIGLTGTTGSIGGGLLSAGACATGTATVTGATTAMTVSLPQPATYPGDGFEIFAYISAANTVTVKVCALVALTPTASTYKVTVHNVIP